MRYSHPNTVHIQLIIQDFTKKFCNKLKQLMPIIQNIIWINLSYNSRNDKYLGRWRNRCKRTVTISPTQGTMTRGQASRLVFSFVRIYARAFSLVWKLWRWHPSSLVFWMVLAFLSWRFFVATPEYSNLTCLVTCYGVMV